MEMLNSQKRAILSSSPVLFEMAGLAYLDLCILYIHFFECQEHERNKCCININVNILLLEPAQAAKEHGATAESTLTRWLVNSGTQVQSQSQRLHCTIHCSLADPLQRSPCSTSAPSPSPGWGAHIQQLCVTWPRPSVSTSAAGQHCSSITSTSPSLPYDPTTSLSWRVVKKPGKVRGFTTVLITIFKSSVNGVPSLSSKQLLKVQKIDLRPQCRKIIPIITSEFEIKI